MRLSVMRRIPFCAGHRLLGHEGKCAALHGHNYTAEFHVTAARVDAVGRVIDFAELKTRLKTWIDDNWDHGFILWDQDNSAIDAIRSVDPHKLFLLPVNPTAEHLADYLLRHVCPKVLDPLDVVCTRVILWETTEASAEAMLGSDAENG